MKTILPLVVLLILLGCNGTTDYQEEYQSNIVIREDLTETEFKEAIIGHWENQFEVSGKKNVETLDISRKGTAKVVISKGGIKDEYSGNYLVNLLRPYEKGTVTLAELIIKINDDSLVLSNLNFGFHNAFGVDEGYFLRIDDEPYGVMKRKN